MSGLHQKRSTKTKNITIPLDHHFEKHIRSQIETGRYTDASEVVHASLRLLEEHERKGDALRQVGLQV